MALCAALANFEQAEDLLRSTQDKTILSLISESIQCLKLWIEKQEKNEPILVVPSSEALVDDS